ncbi:hypothetical protein SCB29_22425 [Paraburkholderia sp. SIMBA_055]
MAAKQTAASNASIATIDSPKGGLLATSDVPFILFLFASLTIVTGY